MSAGRQSSRQPVVLFGRLAAGAAQEGQRGIEGCAATPCGALLEPLLLFLRTHPPNGLSVHFTPGLLAVGVKNRCVRRLRWQRIVRVHRRDSGETSMGPGHR